MLDAQRSIFKNFFSLLTPPNFILLPDFTVSQLSTSHFVPGERKPLHFPKFNLVNKETPLIWTPSMAFSVDLSVQCPYQRSLTLYLLGRLF